MTSSNITHAGIGDTAPESAFSRRLRALLRSIARNSALYIGLFMVLTIVAIAILAPLIYSTDPRDMVAMPSVWPFQDPEYLMGTDALGRDVMAQLLHGARVSLIVGVAAALLGLIIGISVGAVGGYAGGWVDGVLVRITELFQTVPPFLLVIVIVAIYQSTVPVIALAIGLASWPTVARLVRAQFRSIRSSDYVAAARCLGCSTPRIVIFEILPNAIAPIIVTTTVMVANAILTEAGLSFLNMGDNNAVSWGGMIAEGREVLRTDWFLIALPGAAISFTVLGLNLLGNGLNDALNPRAGS